VCETVIDVINPPFLTCRRPRQAADGEPLLAATPLPDLGHREVVIVRVHLLARLVVVVAGRGYIVCGSITHDELLVGKDLRVGAHGEESAPAGVLEPG
jgi:hypothetical protein